MIRIVSPAPLGQSGFGITAARYGRALRSSGVHTELYLIGPPFEEAPPETIFFSRFGNLCSRLRSDLSAGDSVILTGFPPEEEIPLLLAAMCHVRPRILALWEQTPGYGAVASRGVEMLTGSHNISLMVFSSAHGETIPPGRRVVEVPMPLPPFLDGTIFGSPTDPAGGCRGVSISRLTERKRVLELAGAWQSLPITAPSLTVAGSGFDAADSVENALAALIEPSSRVTLRISKLSARERQTLLQQSDFFISISRAETGHQAALEAIAMGLPCFLSDIPAHRAFALHAESVTLLQGDPAQMVDAALLGLEQLPELSALAKADRERLVSSRTDEAIANRLLIGLKPEGR